MSENYSTSAVMASSGGQVLSTSGFLAELDEDSAAGSDFDVGIYDSSDEDWIEEPESDDDDDIGN